MQATLLSKLHSRQILDAEDTFAHWTGNGNSNGAAFGSLINPYGWRDQINHSVHSKLLSSVYPDVLLLPPLHVKLSLMRNFV